MKAKTHIEQLSSKEAVRNDGADRTIETKAAKSGAEIETPSYIPSKSVGIGGRSVLTLSPMTED